MIKVNLCPVEELENQYWYTLDVVVALVLAVGAYIGVQQYLDQVRQEIDKVANDVASLDESTRQLEPELKHFENLNQDIGKLNTKLGALQSITVSKISKYKPVVVIEHLQNLKPDGVWFDSVTFGVESPEHFVIKGQAFDNILVAEFMTGIRATESQEFDNSDVRTQVFFNQMELEDSAIGNTPEGFPEMVGYPSFSIKGHVRERAGAVRPTGEATDLSQGESPRATLRF